MKSFYLLAVLFFFGATFVSSQTVIDPPEVAVEDITVIDEDVAAYSFVVNQSEETKTYLWERNIIQLSEGWTTAVCDLNLCHLSFIEQATFVLDGMSEGTLDVHVYPNNNPGGAVVEVIVTNTEDENDSATGMYYFNQSLSTPERLSERIKVFPNPSIDYLNIENPGEVNRLEFYNIEGRLIKSVQTNGNAQIAVGDLASGNYILRMWDRENKQVSANLLFKE